jgi:hypothetical protein
VAIGVGPNKGTFALAALVDVSFGNGVADSGAPVEGGATVVTAAAFAACAPGGAAGAP